MNTKNMRTYFKKKSVKKGSTYSKKYVRKPKLYLFIHFTETKYSELFFFCFYHDYHRYDN